MSSKKKWIAVSTSFALVLCSGSAALAAKSGVFESPKQLLLNAVNYMAIHSSLASGEDDTITMKLDQLSFNGKTPPSAADILKQFKGNTLVMQSASVPSRRMAELDFTLKGFSRAYSANLWINQNDIIAGLSQFQPLLTLAMGSQLSQANGGTQTVTGQTYGNTPTVNIPKIPKYLFTGPRYATVIQQFWGQLAKENRHTPQQVKAIRDFGSAFVQSIPERNIRRIGVNEISITFNQAQLRTILDSFINTLYQHKARFENDLQSIYGKNSGIHVAGFFAQPKAKIEKQINSAFGSSAFSMGQSTFTLSTGFSGAWKTTMRTGFSISDQKDGLKAHVSLSAMAHSPNTAVIRFPAINKHNSQTFDQFVATSAQSSTLQK